MFKPKKDSRLGWRLQCGTAWTPNISITSRRTCLSRWRKKSFLVLSPLHGSTWFRTTPFAMQYTLPLKQKQIEQSKLEAEARKETTVKNAEAMAQAKVIDSKAENERRKLLAEAEADRIRVTSAADAERMSKEGAILKQNPLLINKIVAEKLSDKLQIMMVPADGKFFFANDVLRSMNMANRTSQAEEAQDPPEK